MRMVSVLKKGIVVGIVLGLAGCASDGGNGGSFGSRNGIGDVKSFYGQNISPSKEKALLAKETLYFGLNRFDVSGDDKLALYAHAKKLLQNPEMRIRLDGHTDERGSRSYNIGLGERRANAAAKILRFKGVPENQIAIVSYGKEKPVALGADENSWSLNRRAELAYEELG